MCHIYIIATCYNYTISNVSYTWHDAAQYCNNTLGGANLAKISYDYEQSEIEALLETAGVDRAWMGLNDITNDGTFEWPDGTIIYRNNSVVIGQFVDFRSLEPNGGTGENCGEVYSTSNGGGWNDLTCTDLYPALCQMECPSPTAMPTNVPSSVPTSMPTSLVNKTDVYLRHS